MTTMAAVFTTTDVFCPVPIASSSTALSQLLKGGTRSDQLPICEISRPASAASTRSSICTESTAEAEVIPDISPDSLILSYANDVSTPHELASLPGRASTPSRTLLSLPFELYRPIFAFVTDLNDLRNLAVASRVTQPDAELFLHSTISAFGIREVTARCRHLARYPRVASFVRKIVFRDLPGADKTWPSCYPLSSFYTVVKSALRNTQRLTYLDASILPTSALPTGPDTTFRLQHFIHDGLVVGLDAINFFLDQSSIEHIILNPFSYYELHEDDEHYRRLLYTILPNLRTVSCGLSVAIRLVESRPLEQFVIPWRQDCLDSDQLERLVRALSSKRERARSSGQAGMCDRERMPLKSLVVERLFAGREGLGCITKYLNELEHLSLVIALGSDWLNDLAPLKHLKSLSIVQDSFFDTQDEKAMLDKLHLSCPSVTSVYIKGEWSRTSPTQSLTDPRTVEANSRSSARHGLAVHWERDADSGEWSCLGDVDIAAVSLPF